MDFREGPLNEPQILHGSIPEFTEKYKYDVKVRCQQWKFQFGTNYICRQPPKRNLNLGLISRDYPLIQHFYTTICGIIIKGCIYLFFFSTTVQLQMIKIGLASQTNLQLKMMKNTSQKSFSALLCFFYKILIFNFLICLCVCNLPKIITGRRKSKYVSDSSQLS